jgi:small subunit ribosomal protein S21e
MQGTDAVPTAEQIELYVPRKCAASNKIIAAKDHAAVQLDIAEVDEQTGRMTGKNRTYALCGSIRMMGEADDSIVRLAGKDGFIGRGYFVKETK